jgi:hypothetical protein
MVSPLIGLIDRTPDGHKGGNQKTGHRRCD